MFYTSKELSQLNTKAPTITFQVSDYDGNKTNYMGLNNLESCNALLEFVLNRKAFIEEVTK